MELIEYKERVYPKLQSDGFAAQYAFPFALRLCKGAGLDIGYNKPEWKLPGAIGIDEGKLYVETDTVEIEVSYNAMNLPYGDYSYIFSSHCLEHLNDWAGVLNYWHSKLKPGGLLFLYLPDCDQQEYWRPMANRKHCNWLRPDMLRIYFEFGGWKNIYVTGHDLNFSFYAIAEKI